MSSISEAIRSWFLEPVLQKLKQEETKMAQSLADLQAAITAVGQAVSDDATQDQAVIVAIEALIAKINASPAAPDFTNEVQALSGIVTTLTNSNKSIQDELTKATA